jgi:hypothetical protein
LFWRILASFWLAITLVAGLSILLGHMLNQDAWILSRHPGLNTLAAEWTQTYEAQGEDAAQEVQELAAADHQDAAMGTKGRSPGTIRPMWRQSPSADRRQR